MQEDTYYAKYLEREYSDETDKDEESTLLPIINEIDSLRTEIQEINDKTSSKTTEKRKLKETEILVNDLLPVFQNVTTDLSENDLEINSTFGSTSKEPRVPNPFLISTTKDVNIRKFQMVLKVAKQNDAEYISLADNIIPNLPRIYRFLRIRK